MPWRLFPYSGLTFAVVIALSSALHLATVSAEQARRTANRSPVHYAMNPRQEILRAGALTWHSETSLPSGAQAAILEGDPAKRGLVILRLKMPDGYHVPSVWHPAADRFTVISGIYHLGVGAKFDAHKTVSLSAGDHAWLSPGAPHFGWCTGETVLEIVGLGPFLTNYVNPDEDPRNK